MAADEISREVSGRLRPLIAGILGQFHTRITCDAPVEHCGRLVVETYPVIFELLAKRGHAERNGEDYRPMVTPFGRRIAPDLIYSRQQAFEGPARKIKSWVESKGYRVYASDIRRQLIDANGKISLMDIRRLARSGRRGSPLKSRTDDAARALTAADFFRLGIQSSPGIEVVDDGEPDDALGYPVYRYDEWDEGAGDYMRDHVRVCRRPVPEDPNDFYQAVLKRHHGLVKKLRYAFELLKPQGVKILRRWVEGDEFDYRALLNVAVDKRAGLIPSDRLYNKRVKQKRDVSVLLLVDISRSTSNRVLGTAASVLDVEKEAIVLFCEALEVVGDDFGIAGFSGTGRLGVDYYSVKEFEETMDDTVRCRINALTPQRSTRMGAAIRHAVRQLEMAPSRVRLLIILGDGFPNDLDYKQGYAVADTRRAVFEARSKDVYTHAITVNISGDPRLDDLYGNVRHTVISDVRELPGKLLRIYGALTRY
jgi:nitric oxide reductase activation protein